MCQERVDDVPGLGLSLWSGMGEKPPKENVDSSLFNRGGIKILKIE